MSQFEPEFYHRYRPLYPPETFFRLMSLLRKQASPYSIADIGCGTGHSLLSLAQAAMTEGLDIHFTGIDPDEQMLNKARQILGTSPIAHESQFLKKTPHLFAIGSGERTQLPDQSQNALIVGSAFHWMKNKTCVQEFARVLRPNGILCIFEYQFPKCAKLPELNEWIRRQFNLLWKAPHQVPRGTLSELTRPFEASGLFKFHGEDRPPMKIFLSSEELTGLILSQSRTLHFLKTLSSPDQRKIYETSLLEEIQSRMPDNRGLFDFRLSTAIWTLEAKN